MIDKVWDAIIVDIAARKKLPRTKVRETVEAYYRTISKVIESEEDRTIKIDYIGTFQFNKEKQKRIDHATKEKHKAKEKPTTES